MLAVVGAAAFLIGVSKGGVGGGLGPLITILVAVATTPSQAIGVLLPLLMIGDVAAVWVHRRDWGPPDAAPAAAGSGRGRRRREPVPLADL